MKLLTLNTHSLHGEEQERREAILLDGLLRERPDVIALQEVNQTHDAPPLPAERLADGFVGDARHVLRRDNYAQRLAQRLARARTPYFWCWVPVKRGYGRFDEGLAFFTRLPIAEYFSFFLSRTQAYDDWRCRKALCIRLEGQNAWFYNLHMGWWQDTAEPFSEQWSRFLHRKRMAERIWVMGDMNNPPSRRGEGYDQIASTGFYDCYTLAKERNGEATVFDEIDGWRGATEARGGLRIDQIWCDRPVGVRACRTLFDGACGQMVSDHAAVLAEIEEGGRKV